MRKTITAALAAITTVATVAGAAGSAEARDYRDYRGYHHRNNDTGVAIAAGVVGLALGAAIAGNNDRGYRPSYGSSYYDNGYYAPPRGYGYYGPPRGYRTCESRERVYDPYIGRRVVITRRYAC